MQNQRTHEAGAHPASAHDPAHTDPAHPEQDAPRADAPETPGQQVVQVPGTVVSWAGFTMTVAPDIVIGGQTVRGGWLLTASPPT